MWLPSLSTQLPHFPPIKFLDCAHTQVKIQVRKNHGKQQEENQGEIQHKNLPSLANAVASITFLALHSLYSDTLVHIGP